MFGAVQFFKYFYVSNLFNSVKVTGLPPVWERAANLTYEGISKSFEPNMERARNLDLFCFIFQRSPLPTRIICNFIVC